MNEIFHRLNLKGSFSKTFDAATDDELAELFSEMKKIDATVDISDTSQEKVRNKTDLLNFLKTHCVQKHMFSVKKCDNVSCTTCLPPRLPNSVFSTLYHLPDPMPNGEHFKTFQELYGAETSECHLPCSREKEAKGHKLPFSPTAQTAKNTDIFLICEECRKPRLLHSPRKLMTEEKVHVETIFEDLQYSCGADIHCIDASESDTALIGKISIRMNDVCKTI